MSLNEVRQIQQIFIKHGKEGSLVIILMEIFDILASGTDDALHESLMPFNYTFKLGILKNGLENAFFGLNEIPLEVVSISAWLWL